MGVVFIHSRIAAEAFSNGDTAVNYRLSEFVQYLISEGIARIAVPLFFLISGYLFMWGIEWSIGSYWGKVKSRTKSLLVPFLFWNLLTLSVIALAQSWSVTRGLFTGKNTFVADFSSFEYAEAILGIGCRPIAYHFWFIRDLMILVLLTPVIHQLNKRVPVPFMLFLFSVWFFVWIDFGVPEPVGVLFYSLGCYLGHARKSLFSLDRFGPAAFVAYGITLMANTVWADGVLYPYVQRTAVMLGIVSCLYSTKFLAGPAILRQVLISLGAASFFVYAAHEPLLTALIRCVYKVMHPAHSGPILALYFAIPACLITALVLTHRVSSYFLPKLTRVITGAFGRDTGRLTQASLPVDAAGVRERELVGTAQENEVGLATIGPIQNVGLSDASH